MSKAKVGTKGAKVEMDNASPEEVQASMKAWEQSIEELQRTQDVGIIDGLIASQKQRLAATGPAVSLDANPLGAKTQAALQGAIQILEVAKNQILKASLAPVVYEDEGVEIEDDEEA